MSEQFDFSINPPDQYLTYLRSYWPLKATPELIDIIPLLCKERSLKLKT